MPRPSDLYAAARADGSLRPDPAQERAILALDKLYEAVMAPAVKPGLLARLRRGERPAAASGVYLHGPVGRGKTRLMDLFFAALPDTVKKRRVHFHAFMLSVHAFLHAQRLQGGADGVDNILPRFAASLAREIRVLCFDEFHVVDIADAMILQRLFTALLSAGITLVATSNVAPNDLYKEGLKRDHFLPFIAFINDRMQVVAVDGGHDYRANRIAGRPVYFTPLNLASDTAVNALFADLTDGDTAEPFVLHVAGRQVAIPRAAHGVARAYFSDLCEKPLAAADYLALAGAFHTLVLEHVPKLGYDRRNEAKRFMILVDILYEHHHRLIISAEADPDKLYTGHDHAFEFQRTISRLNEMQSESYLQEIK